MIEFSTTSNPGLMMAWLHEYRIAVLASLKIPVSKEKPKMRKGDKQGEGEDTD